MMKADCGRGLFDRENRYELLPRGRELGNLVCCSLSLSLLLIHKFRSVAMKSPFALRKKQPAPHLAVLRKFDFLWALTELVVGGGFPGEQQTALKLGVSFPTADAEAPPCFRKLLFVLACFRNDRKFQKSLCFVLLLCIYVH